MNSMHRSQDVDSDRRRLLAGACALGAANLLGARGNVFAADPQPETTRLRLVNRTNICLAPQYLADELLRAEGFANVQYVQVGSRSSSIEAVIDGRADLTMADAYSVIPYLDSGKPVTVIAGVHGGCYQVLGNERVNAIRDLRGKTVAVHYSGDGGHVLLAAMLAYVGIKPQQEVEWITGGETRNAMDLFAEGRADAFVGFSQEPVELRQRKIGRVIVDIGRDRPWSQYFCCVVVANRGFVQRHPVATKRALRALLKGADICASDPERAARFLVEMRYETRYPIGLEVMRNSQFDRWRTAHPEDTLRFYGLRLREGGLVKSAPDKLIAQGTDWRFLNELRRELKA